MIGYTLYDINKHEVLDLQDDFIEEAVKDFWLSNNRSRRQENDHGSL